jgi:hypothetical protein
MVIGTKYLIGSGRGTAYSSCFYLHITRAHRTFMKDVDLKDVQRNLRFHMSEFKKGGESPKPKFKVLLERRNV